MLLASLFSYKKTAVAAMEIHHPALSLRENSLPAAAAWACGGLHAELLPASDWHGRAYSAGSIPQDAEKDISKTIDNIWMRSVDCSAKSVLISYFWSLYYSYVKNVFVF